MTAIARLVADGAFPLFGPDADEYRSSTRPDNSSVVQTPVAVAVPVTVEELSDVVRAARSDGLKVAVQSTGHGAARTLGNDTVLVSTARFDAISVDAQRHRVRVGAGVVWSQVQAAAEPYGLLGRSGTSPGVGVAGYTFGGGLGWLTRAHGLASSALLTVDFVDGRGELRSAALDAPDEADREALWAFRGGAPVGIAVSVEFDLVVVPKLWAGYQLWPASQADPLIRTWAGHLSDLDRRVTSTMAIFRAPPVPGVPPELVGQPVLHLSLASVDGPEPMQGMLDDLRAVAAPAVDTVGPSDAAELATIHLDPPVAVPSLGDGRWLGPIDGDRAVGILRAARVGQPDGLAMIELRHVATTPTEAEGAMTNPVGPMLVHSVGVVTSAAAVGVIDAAHRRVRQAGAPADRGRAAVSFRDGRAHPDDAYPAELAARILAIGARLDPESRFTFERMPQG